MRQIVILKTETTAATDDVIAAGLMAAMAAFMAADSDAEAVAEIDRDLKRAA